MKGPKCLAWGAALALSSAGLAASVPASRAPPVASTHFAGAPSDLFARFDADGDGRVIEREYVAYLGLGFTARDVDGSGVLDGRELPPGAQPLARGESEARLRRQFTRQDANRDGALDARELMAPPRG